MRIDILTIFPEVFTPLDVSIIRRARDRGCVDIHVWNLRDFAIGRRRTVDDAPYGGGRGMVMKCEPISRGLKTVKKENPGAAVILTTPQGDLLNQQMASRLSKEPGLIILCGHYEGVDERVASLCDYEISIGDYVLTGGEIPAMAITDAVVRLLPGALPSEAPVADSFSEILLDWPCYTRPPVFQGRKVPRVLLSGDHAKIREWRRKKAIERTRERRPDLYKKFLEREGAAAG